MTDLFTGPEIYQQGGGFFLLIIVIALGIFGFFFVLIFGIVIIWIIGMLLAGYSMSDIQKELENEINNLH